MFVRKKQNKSGVISVQVIDKSTGFYKVVFSVGSSSDIAVVENLVLEGQEWVRKHKLQLDIFSEHNRQLEEKQVVDYVLNNISSVLLNGVQLLVNNIYDSIGFNKIDDSILRYLVTARLMQPLSKLATVDFLKSYYNEDVALHHIYRYMDKLYYTQQDLIQKISITHTTKILGGSIGLMFYDVTTIYFETEQQDDLRATGFSKDGKHSNAQIVLGLLVSKDGYPLSYSIFNGAQFEGYTMLPIIDDIVLRYQLSDFVIVADAGLMNSKNIELLEQGGYKYILGAKIKTEKNAIKEWIMEQEKVEDTFHETKIASRRLIINYSEARAKKDAHNREKGVTRLEKLYKTGKITKENINKKGYNKFLQISKNIEVEISKDKIEADQKWDGWKGYITNTSLSAKEVCQQYNGLWVIEKAFRVAKTNLEIRPVFHFTSRRIEAHVSICFIAYKIYKEFERKLKITGLNLSVDKVLAIAKTITTVNVNLPISGKTTTKTLIVNNKQKEIEHLFDPKFWNS